MLYVVEMEKSCDWLGCMLIGQRSRHEEQKTKSVWTADERDGLQR